MANALVTKGTSLTREDQTAGRRVIEQGIPSLLIVAADELRRRGVTLGPEWRTPLAAARAFAERARAPWYERKLDEIEREVGAP